MKNINLKQFIPHLIIIGVFLAITVVYFSPYLEGKTLNQMDNNHAKGMAQELNQYHEQTGEYSMWTNSMFGGMPAYLIKSGANKNIFSVFNRLLRFNLPDESMAIVFISLLFFYVLLLVLKVDPWLSMIGAFAFTFSTYNFIIIQVGHICKAYALAYSPLVLAGLIITYRGKYIWGGLLSLIALGLEFSASHPQITYYVFLIIGLFVLIQFIYAIIEKSLQNFLKSSAVLLVAIILSILPTTTNLWTTYEWGKYSIRGPSELKQQAPVDNQDADVEAAPIKSSKVSTGLDKDYALGWSYGKAETFTLLIPYFAGRHEVDNLEDTAVIRKIQESKIFKTWTEEIPQDTQNAANYSYQLVSYWGAMPFTGGPVYFGAIICFLFILGLVIVKGQIKWWLLSITVLSIMLAWGKNLSWFTDLFFDYFPMYNKFRAVSTTLVIAELSMPLLGFLALKTIYNKELEKTVLLKKFNIAFGITLGLVLILAFVPDIFISLITPSDLNFFESLKNHHYPNEFISKLTESIHDERLSIIRSSAFTSFTFIFLSGALIWLFIKEKIKSVILISGLALLVVIDLWIVDKRYLNEKDFVVKSSLQESTFPTDKAQEFIAKDKDPDFRVFNIAANTFNDGISPYYYKSIGGYHGAKLRRYQDVIDHYLMPARQNVIYLLQHDSTGRMLPIYLKQSAILNMLNTKYIVINPQANPITNNQTLGNAWFVKKTKFVNNADEELQNLNNLNPAQTAIIDKRFKELIPSSGFTKDSNSVIRLTSYKPDHLTYSTETASQQLAVFSEIYYEKGWNAYVDGKLNPHFRANYLLRAMMIPAGKHTIDFKFEPKSYSVGQQISSVSSILILILIFGAIFWEYKKSKSPVTEKKK